VPEGDPNPARRGPKIAAAACSSLVYPVFRSFPFRGMGRLRPYLPVPESGTPVVSFRGGPTLRLDLAEAHQRDLFFGLYDRLELSLMRRALAAGGDFVDVGAHIGFYSVAAARAVTPLGGRVLAFEPNPVAREQLTANLRLNDLDVEVVPKAVGDAPGRAVLHVPATRDPSWSSLRPGHFEEGDPIEVEVTTVDAEVAARELRPAFVKIDVEGLELAVLAGMQHVLDEHRPVLLVEVSEGTADEAAALLARRGYDHYRVGRRLARGFGDVRGIFNAVFVPDGHAL
jgi:FkbM family methyltransferase